jgi:hypothetical protein
MLTYVDIEAADAQVESTRLAAVQHQLRLLQVEKGKLSELSDLLKRKLAQARRYCGSIKALLRRY